MVASFFQPPQKQTTSNRRLSTVRCYFCCCFLRISLINWHLITLLNINWDAKMMYSRGPISASWRHHVSLKWQVNHVHVSKRTKIFVFFGIINSLLIDYGKIRSSCFNYYLGDAVFQTDLWFMQNMCMHIALSLFIY